MLPAGIARELEIDEESVRTHAKRAIKKLGASTRIEAVVIHSRVHRTCHS
jgi:DNA-binding NarL/FixJ family response regulator